MLECPPVRVYRDGSRRAGCLGSRRAGVATPFLAGVRMTFLTTCHVSGGQNNPSGPRGT